MRELKKWWSKNKYKEENTDWTYEIQEFKTSFYPSNFPPVSQKKKKKKGVISHHHPHVTFSSAILID